MAKIEYIWLRLHNAYLYEECYVPLDKQGLVLIRGLNLDDGGFLATGKSSIPDSLARVQFGKGGKQEAVADIVNFKHGKNLEITLRLRVNDHPFEIRQYRKHQQYGTALQVIDLESGENLLPQEFRNHPQVWIREQLLHTDETSFFNTAYLTQSHTHVLLHGKETERRQSLSSMFGLDLYDQFAEQLHQLERVSEGDISYLARAKDRLREVKERLAAIGDLEQEQQKWQRAVARLEAAQTGLMAATQELDRLQGELAGLKLRYNLEQELEGVWKKATTLRSKFSTAAAVTPKKARLYQRRLVRLTRQRVRLETRLEGNRTRSILASQLASLDEDLKSAGDLDQVEKDLSDAKTRIHHLNTVELPAAEKRRELEQQLTKVGRVSGDLTKMRAEHTELVERVADLEKRIRRDTTRLEKGICSECKRPLDLSLEEVEQLQESVRTHRSELKQARAKQYERQTELDLLSKRHDLKIQLEAITTTSTVEEVDKTIGELVRKERKLSRLVELVKQKSTLESTLSTLPELEPGETAANLKQITADVAEVKTLARFSNRVADLNRKLKKLSAGDRRAVEKQVQELRGDVRSFSQRIGRLSKKVADYEVKLRDAAGLKLERRELRRKVHEGKEMGERLACLSVLRQAFGPKGLKQRRLHAILDDATENTIPAYSQLLWPNKQISLELEDNDGLHFFLRREGQKQLVRSNVISGGEKHKAGLAFLLGLRDLKELYTASSFNVLIVDEPFGNLDPQGEQAFLGILELLKERFGSIFIISHRPEVLGSSVWDQTWWAIRKNSTSKLYLGDPPAKYLRLAESFSTTDGD